MLILLLLLNHLLLLLAIRTITQSYQTRLFGNTTCAADT